MKKKLLQVIGLFSAILVLSGCSNANKNPGPFPVPVSENPAVSESGETIPGETVNLTEGRTPKEIESGDVSPEQFSALSDASVKLLYQTMQDEEDPNKNILISPLSVQTALGMAELGAEGDTLKQMEKIVNGNLSREKLALLVNSLAKTMQNAPDVEWNVANSLWFRDDGIIVPKEDYLNDVVSHYHSDVFKAPFDNRTLKDINGWVDTETKHMIPEIISEIPEEAYMYLINAVAFEAEWQEPYEDDQVQEGRYFTNLDGSETETTMLASKEYGYFTLEGGKGFLKPYKGGEYSFVGILPEEGQSPEEYLKKISSSGADFSKAVREAEDEEVNVLIPEFTQDYNKELSEIFKEMEMEQPFNPEQAEFYQMMEPVNQSPYQVWIGKILHKTHIEVDRKGTKAAAVTAVQMEMCTAVMPVEEVKTVRLDRPFVYAVVDNATGYPVFFGVQNSMQ